MQFLPHGRVETPCLLPPFSLKVGGAFTGLGRSRSKLPRWCLLKGRRSQGLPLSWGRPAREKPCFLPPFRLKVCRVPAQRPREVIHYVPPVRSRCRRLICCGVKVAHCRTASTRAASFGLSLESNSSRAPAAISWLSLRKFLAMQPSSDRIFLSRSMCGLAYADFANHLAAAVQHEATRRIPAGAK
jgi:hypothetical protein